MIAFIDTDDIWFSEKLEKCHEVINKKDVDLIYHSVNYINKKIFKDYKRKIKKISVQLKNIYIQMEILLLNLVLLLKEEIGRNWLFFRKKEFYGWEDFDAWIRLAFNSNKFFFKFGVRRFVVW